MKTVASFLILLVTSLVSAETKPLIAVAYMFQGGGSSSHGVDLSWSDDTSKGQITGHNVYRSATAGVCKWTTGTSGSQVLPTGCTKIGSSAVTNFSDTSSAVQTEGAKFFYVETATGPGGESASSNEASATIPFSVPAAPTQNAPVPR